MRVLLMLATSFVLATAMFAASADSADACRKAGGGREESCLFGRTVSIIAQTRGECGPACADEPIREIAIDELANDGIVAPGAGSGGGEAPTP